MYQEIAVKKLITSDGKKEVHIYTDDNTSFDQGDQVILLFSHRDFYIKYDGLDAKDVYDESDNGNELFTYKYSYETIKYYVFPVSAYIHSGVVLYLADDFNRYKFNGDHWDFSNRGYILVNTEFGTKEEAYKTASNYIKEWNMYLQGDIYKGILYKRKSYVKTYEDGTSYTGADLEEIDRIYGYIGDPVPVENICHNFDLSMEELQEIK